MGKFQNDPLSTDIDNAAGVMMAIYDEMKYGAYNIKDNKFKFWAITLLYELNIQFT